jgi:hypothetical protein
MNWNDNRLLLLLSTRPGRIAPSNNNILRQNLNMTKRLSCDCDSCPWAYQTLHANLNMRPARSCSKCLPRLLTLVSHLLSIITRQPAPLEAQAVDVDLHVHLAAVLEHP